MPVPILDGAAVRPDRPSECAVTVVFATRNRAEALATVLEGFTCLLAPEGGWKLVVVDNGSVDDTAARLGSYVDRLPLTVLSEPRAGKNRALNAALPHFEGDLIVLTDDDVIPKPDWLQQLARAADEHPEASLFGGTILPRWSRPRPSWLTERAVPFNVLYSQHERGPGPCSHDAIFGPNMAVRASVFTQGLRFSETVGPDETKPLYAMGSETEFLRRAQDAGHGGWFVPQAVVGHLIRPEQTDEDWILKRAYRYGYGEGLHYIAPNPGLGGALAWLPQPLRLRLRAAIFGLAYRLAGLAPPSAWRLRIRYKARAIAGANDAQHGRPASGLPSRPS